MILRFLHICHIYFGWTNCTVTVEKIEPNSCMCRKVTIFVKPKFLPSANHKLQINLTPQASSLATPPVQNMIWVNMMMLIQMATCAKHPRKNGGQTKQGFLANLLRHYRHLFHWHWHLSLSCYIVAWLKTIFDRELNLKVLVQRYNQGDLKRQFPTSTSRSFSGKSSAVSP